MVAFVDEFENVAPDAWLAEFREGRWARRLNDSMNRLDGIVVAADRGAFVTFDANGKFHRDRGRDLYDPRPAQRNAS